MKTFPNSLLLLSIAWLWACGNDNSEIEPDLTNEIIITTPDTIPVSSLAIINVNVITMVNESVLPDQTVILQGDQIQAIGPSSAISVPEDVQVIDAMGIGYLIPGLMDMHFHRSTVKDLFLFAANGVMVVREMWGSIGMLNFSRQILDEKMDQPQVFVASPGMNGSGGAFDDLTPPVDDPAVARELVKSYKEEGFHFVKAYNKLEPAVYEAIIDEAAKQDIPVIGHVPVKVGTKRAFESGQMTSEHFLGFGYFAIPQGSIYRGNVDLNKANELIDKSIAGNVWLTPTVVVDVQSPESIQHIRQSDEYQLISESLKEWFETGFAQGNSAYELAKDNKYKILKAIIDRNGKILLGTDAGFGYVIPGFSIHEELQHYVAAGLTNFEALKTATTNPAEYLEIDELTGTIEVGKRADLILLESNPLDDIGATRDRAGIILRGKWLSQPHLFKLLTEE